MCLLRKGMKSMGYFEKLFMGNAFPLEEIQDAVMASERGRELTAILSQTSQALATHLSCEVKEAFENYKDAQDCMMELMEVGAFKLGYAYGTGMVREIEQLPIPFEPN